MTWDNRDVLPVRGPTARAVPSGSEANRERSPVVPGDSWPPGRVRQQWTPADPAPQDFNAAGAVAVPTAGQALVTLNPVPAGLYDVDVRWGYSAAVEATTGNNFDVRRDGLPLFVLATPRVLTGDHTWAKTFRIRLDGAETLTVNAIAAASAGTVYLAQLTARRVGN